MTVASEPHEWSDGVCSECAYECLHTDGDTNHICDICEKVISDHEDVNRDHVCDHCGKTISNHKDTDQNHICDYCGKVISNHEDTDQNHICDYCGKVISNHTGGKATCAEKAACEVCGKAYGEPDAHNHAALNHSEATAATKDAEGNIEYWYCEACGKYYADAAASREITKAATVTEKLSNETKSPQTGDAGSRMLWFALLFIGGGAGTALTVKRKNLRRYGGNEK